VDLLLLSNPAEISEYLPAFYRCRNVFVSAGAGESIPQVAGILANGVPCAGGTIFTNELLSLKCAETPSVYEDFFVRDYPFRFLKKAAEIVQRLGLRHIVEVGGCSTPLSHPLDVLSSECCSRNGHSTAHWCAVAGSVVHSVDREPSIEDNINRAFDLGWFVVRGKLKLHIDDGMTFLSEIRENVKRPVQFLFLDAFDDAKMNQRAIELAGDYLAETHLVGFGNADTPAGNLLAFMKDNGYIVLCAGRVALFYRGDLDKLVKWCE